MITAAQYLDSIYEFLNIQTALEDSTNKLGFIKDGAWPYRTEAVFHFLSDRATTLELRMHTQSGMELSPHSPHLIPRDVFLWFNAMCIVTIHTL
ncbi:hypothetical protein TNCT_283851 [Trichonephila clavata]|uniref:Uncharacterized protein n=1 Tax=Trichonephila clavata TaxID=2740835 RepID=A0A8X6J8J4_TRICU|nr:hypothetical protein TNCT_283851 [Trichonephila clavata]